MASPTLDAVDKAQRLRRINDALSELVWLTAIYPIEQHPELHIWLQIAKIAMEKAKNFALAEVE